MLLCGIKFLGGYESKSNHNVHPNLIHGENKLNKELLNNNENINIKNDNNEDIIENNED